MVEDIKKTWANAQSLSVYFNALIASNKIDEVAISKKFGWRPSTDIDPSTSLAQAVNSLGQLSIDMEMSRQKTARRKHLIEGMRNQMVLGEVVAFGRVAVAGGLDQIVALTDDHWIGAEVNPEDDEVVIGGNLIHQVRIVFTETASTPKKARRGPVSKSDIRREVITACYAVDPKLLNQSPEIRLRTYKRYIEKHHKDVDLRRGFSQSAFQEDEQYLRDNSLI